MMKAGRLFAANFLVLALAPSAHAGDTVSGQIASFECGDNCYLTIAAEGGTDLTGLCVAEECGPWNAETAIPEDQLGQMVIVTVGTAEQLDGEGNTMGSFVSFTEIVFVDSAE